jgi:phosphatidate cytidylyltransferase
VLKQRLVTAAILIPLFSAAVLNLPTRYFALLLAAVLLVAAWEWGRLLRLPTAAWSIFMLAFVAMISLVAAGKISQAAARVISAAAMIWWAGSALWIVRYQGDEARVLPPWRGMIAGWLVLAPAFVSLCALHAEAAHGPGYVLFLLALIWAADSGAYFAGRGFGRHKLAPRVSPGKSWEGVVGGMSAAALSAVAGARLLGLPGEAMLWFVPLCLAVAMFSVVGDLLESLFKRAAGVKDSGRFLPGHGGALDRIDSITAAAPAFYLGLSLIEWPT